MNGHPVTTTADPVSEALIRLIEATDRLFQGVDALEQRINARDQTLNSGGGIPRPRALKSVPDVVVHDASPSSVGGTSEGSGPAMSTSVAGPFFGGAS